MQIVLSYKDFKLLYPRLKGLQGTLGLTRAYVHWLKDVVSCFVTCTVLSNLFTPNKEIEKHL